jgi:hypothetical protein
MSPILDTYNNSPQQNLKNDASDLRQFERPVADGADQGSLRGPTGTVGATSFMYLGVGEPLWALRTAWFDRGRQGR